MGKTWVREAPATTLTEQRSGEAQEKAQPKVFKRKANVWVRSGTQFSQSPDEKAPTISEADQVAKRRRLMAQGRLPRATPSQTMGSVAPRNGLHPDLDRTEQKGTGPSSSGLQNGRSQNNSAPAEPLSRPANGWHQAMPSSREGNTTGAAPKKPQGFSKASESGSPGEGSKLDKGEVPMDSQTNQADLIQKMKQQIADAEANLTALKNRAKQKAAEESAEEQHRRVVHNHRQQNLNGWLAGAFQLQSEGPANGERPQKVKAAEAAVEEIKRILAAKTDHQVMQTWPGITREVLDKKYRALSRVLHPDKCKEPGAADAYQKMREAHQNVIKFTI